MTPELKEALDRELDAALASGDPKQIDRAIVNSQKATQDCQLKTAERVKIIAADHPVLVADVKEIKDLVSSARRKFRDIAFSALKWIIVGGGAGEFIRFLCTGRM